MDYQYKKKINKNIHNSKGIYLCKDCLNKTANCVIKDNYDRQEYKIAQLLYYISLMNSFINLNAYDKINHEQSNKYFTERYDNIFNIINNLHKSIN